MRLGFASLFGFRPHAEHLAYLAGLARAAGHEVSVFACAGSVSACYPRNLRRNRSLAECAKCLTGGLASYPVGPVTTVHRRWSAPLSADRLRNLTLSSVATVLRTGPPSDYDDPAFRRMQEQLAVSVQAVYGSARRWIERERLDGAVFFNGRMDLTAGLQAACEDAKLPFATTERAWFGHGIHLYPNENCLALAPANRLVDRWRDVPLVGPQAALAGRVAAERFLRRTTLDWRQYNLNETPATWPGRGPEPRVLILPSSENEREGHPAMRNPWADYTVGMDGVVGALKAAPSNVVVRAHPNWGEKIGRETGWRSERHCADWAARRGYVYVPSTDRRSTYDLILGSQVVVVNGTTGGFEAAVAGRRVVNVGHCVYERAGFAVQVDRPDVFAGIPAALDRPPREIVRRVLRFLYLLARRFPQYVDQVRALSTTRYAYFEGGDPARLTALLRSGELSADDALAGERTDDEDRVIDAVLAGRWEELARFEEAAGGRRRVPLRRRLGLNWIDRVRDLLPRGDR